MRLAILLGSIALVVAVGVKLVSGSSRRGAEAVSSPAPRGGTSPPRLDAAVSPIRLPVAIHGEAASADSHGLLLIGGETSAGTSTARVYRIDPATGRSSPEGTLAQPLHDAAAASVGERTVVFGGGSSSTLDLVQRLMPGGIATPIGHLPDAVSDLSAVGVGGATYLLGGYDGSSPTGAVLETTDGRSFRRVARLPGAVRYTAAAPLGGKIYAFGGELGSGADTDEIQEYDPETDRTVLAGRLPAAVSHAAAVSLDGAIYLLGGRVSGTASDRILRFDPARGAAAPAGRLPYPMFDGAAVVRGGRAYLLGGLGHGGAPLDSAIELRP